MVAIEKPSRFQVHPPQEVGRTLSRRTNCLYLLSKQLGQKVYPVHRLDRATSGVLLFALISEVAAALQKQFQNQEIKKIYHAVTRGWWTPLEGTLDYSLKVFNASTPDFTKTRAAQTRYRSLSQIELPHGVGKYSSARYSFLEVEPLTGRRHQIRRHFSHFSHPLLGDTIYGDGKHNQAMFLWLGERELLLRAVALSFQHPVKKEFIRIHAEPNPLWRELLHLFQIPH